jgi:hypothetical protein
VRIDQGFSPDAPLHFLMALNDSPFIIPSFVSSKRVPGPPPLNFSLRSKDEALEQEASEAYIDHLRRLADEWIDSGKSRSGEGENPVERRLTPNLRELLDGWASRNKPFIGFKPSGDIVLFMPACKMDFSSPLEAARNEAVRLFATFMDSPHRSRLCKCRRCNVYYYTQRQPRGYIKNGTYCPKHRNSASANRSNLRRRIPERKRKLNLASRCWGRWPKRLTDAGTQAQWVAETVNEKLDRYCTPISRNWVTRNRAEIGAEAQLTLQGN